jgi:hypothetical protein
MNNSLNSTIQKIPGIGDIPVLGYLFRSRAYQKNDTELVVMVTPTIVRRGSTGVSPALPSLVEPYLDRPAKSLPPPTPYVGSPRYPANAPAPKSSQQPAPAPEPQAETVARPIQGSATLPDAKPNQPVLAAVPSKIPDAPAKSAPHKPMTKAEIKAEQKQREALDKQREELRKAAEVAAKHDAEQQKATQKKTEEDRRIAEKQEKERAEAAKRKAEEDAKRDKAMADAAARLKAAQAAYQAELEKAKVKK